MVQLLNILNVFGIPECVFLVYIHEFTKNKCLHVCMILDGKGEET